MSLPRLGGSSSPLNDPDSDAASAARARVTGSFRLWPGADGGAGVAPSAASPDPSRSADGRGAAPAPIRRPCRRTEVYSLKNRGCERVCQQPAGAFGTLGQPFGFACVLTVIGTQRRRERPPDAGSVREAFGLEPPGSGGPVSPAVALNRAATLGDGAQSPGVASPGSVCPGRRLPRGIYSAGWRQHQRLHALGVRYTGARAEATSSLSHWSARGTSARLRRSSTGTGLACSASACTCCGVVNGERTRCS